MTPPAFPPSPRPKVSPAWIGAGLVIVAVGFALPMVATDPRLWSTPTREAPRTHAEQPPAAASSPPTGPISPPVAGKTPPRPLDPPAATGIAASLVKFGIGLVVVCGLCILVARWVATKSPPATGETSLTVVASLDVGPSVLHLVRAGERRLLVGTDAAGVKTLLELPGPAPEPLLASPAVAAVAGPSAGPGPTPRPVAAQASASLSASGPDEIVQLVLRLADRTRPPVSA
jgi:flagellar biogenesis protein FliO